MSFDYIGTRTANDFDFEDIEVQAWGVKDCSDEIGGHPAGICVYLRTPKGKSYEVVIPAGDALEMLLRGTDLAVKVDVKLVDVALIARPEA